jgi:NTP pyrophosphatase (non-canonical NTP hydrolase)
MGVALPQNPKLQEAQSFIVQACKEFGFSANGPELVMLLSEEVGEIAKEVRRLHFQEKVTPETRAHLGHEIVDALNYLCRIAEFHGIKLEEAYAQKNKIILERYQK